jgi:hypothetical protein
MGQTEASMSFQQTGTKDAPFNVNQPIAYKVQLTNGISSPMRYEVELEVGPDYTDYSASKKYTSDLSLTAHSSQDVSFDVNFRSPEMSRGAFGEWATDDNDTTTWEKSWYRVLITPLVGDPVTLESYDGEPTLIKMVTAYKNAEVSPKMGTSDTLYSYRIDVFSSAEDVVSLQVAPETIGPWTDVGSRNYTNVGAWQTLVWENVSLDLDFIKAHYRFLGRKQTETFEGPFWPVEYEYASASVDPADGFSGAPFTYRLDFKGSKSLDVGLNIWDIDQNAFKLVGKKRYENTTSWQRMEWSGVMPSETIGSEGTSSYYFSIYYPDTEASFGTSREVEGKVYPGPEIVLIKYENPTVSPEKGSSIATYIYSVEVDTSLPVCDIELQTMVPGTSLWRSQGIATYNGDPRISWQGVSLDGDAAGNASYRFIRVDSPPATYFGPEIIKESITGLISPSNASIGSWDSSFHKPGEGLVRTPFVYSVEVDSAETTDPLVVKLEVYDPLRKAWIEAGNPQSYDFSEGSLNFTLDELPFAELFLGESRFRFLSGTRYLDGVDGFAGPNVVVNFRNKTWNVTYDKARGEYVYTYGVEVRSSMNLSVDLATTMDRTAWDLADDPREYASEAAEWKRLVWEGYPYYLEVDFLPVGESI